MTEDAHFAGTFALPSALANGRALRAVALRTGAILADCFEDDAHFARTLDPRSALAIGSALLTDRFADLAAVFYTLAVLAPEFELTNLSWTAWLARADRLGQRLRLPLRALTRLAGQSGCTDTIARLTEPWERGSNRTVPYFRAVVVCAVIAVIGLALMIV